MVREINSIEKDNSEIIEEGLNQLLLFKEGDDSKATITIFSIPDHKYNAREISNLRKRLKVSQKIFAYIIGVSCRTVESWEIGRSFPNGAANRLLYLIEDDETIIDRIIKCNKK